MFKESTHFCFTAIFIIVTDREKRIRGTNFQHIFAQTDETILVEPTVMHNSPAL
jgi:hypothetical protein